jgi:hypothetical protein
MSFFKKLFGGGSTPQIDNSPAPVSEHKGFTIQATPYQEQGQWQMCGVIEKTIDGEVKSHRFIRADKFGSREQAAEFTISKAQQIIDQMGEHIFK